MCGVLSVMVHGCDVHGMCVFSFLFFWGGEGGVLAFFLGGVFWGGGIFGRRGLIF